MRCVGIEDPAFDPTEFKLILHDCVPPQAEEEPPAPRPRKKKKAVEEEDLWALRQKRLRSKYVLEMYWWIFPLVAAIVARLVPTVTLHNAV